MQHYFLIDADHFQFYLEDISIDHDTSILWDEDELLGNPPLAVLDGLLAIGTVRWGQQTKVGVELRQQPPTEIDETQWEQIAEASIMTRAGVLKLITPEGDDQLAPQIEVSPGTYRVRIYYGNLSSVQDELAPQGDDTYYLVLWFDSYVPPRILKPLAGA
jgi:hypothetical protein